MKKIALALALCGLLAACGDDAFRAPAELIPCPCAIGQTDQFVVPERSDAEHVECTKLPPGATVDDVGDWSPIVTMCKR